MPPPAGLSLLALGAVCGVHGVYAGLLNGGLNLPGMDFPLLAAGIFLVTGWNCCCWVWLRPWSRSSPEP